MGRTAHDAVRPGLLHAAMADDGTLHCIEDDLGEGWLGEWIERGIGAIEVYLEKHLAFQTYLDDAPAS
jgi:hypothetical protein